MSIRSFVSKSSPFEGLIARLILGCIVGSSVFSHTLWAAESGTIACSGEVTVGIELERPNEAWGFLNIVLSTPESLKGKETYDIWVKKERDLHIKGGTIESGDLLSFEIDSKYVKNGVIEVRQFGDLKNVHLTKRAKK